MRPELRKIGCAALLLLSACARSSEAKSPVLGDLADSGGYPQASPPPAPPSSPTRSFESVMASAPGVMAEEVSVQGDSAGDVGSETVALGFKAEDKPADTRMASGSA